ncbi:NifB/NifX family molybdenum-iron cluster-binding protein [Candidatus Aerophobetes bacterium]|nr:NifB/NifX family molybdenum-iron cluster-binding protein [Candidatus Aerophobetes bacterium]
MKIAISTDKETVSSHFGRCPSFTIVEIEEGKLKKKEKITNPGHHPGFLPDFFQKQGVECIVCGGMGQRAQELFAQKDIEAILGVQGKIDEVVDEFLKGKLKGGNSLCQPGKGKGYGIPKTEI